VRAFVEQAKASGLVAQAIEQAKLVGVNVAPLASGSVHGLVERSCRPVDETRA